MHCTLRGSGTPALIAACLALCGASTTASAQSRSMTPPPAAAPAPATCVAPTTAAQHVAPGHVTVSSGEVAGKPNSKARQWTVQIASYESLEDAQTMQQSLCQHGFDARIVGVARPYMVRVGRYPSSQDALVAARRLTTPKLTVFVTPAER
jgi:cell division protein FtsN